MVDAAARAFFHALAQLSWLRRLASRYGMARDGGFARRFIAGESIDEAVVAVRSLAERGLLLSLDYLGESVATSVEADAATREYRDILATIVASGIERNVSLKLTQLGLDVDRACAVDNLRKILDHAGPAGFFVRIDMENSPYTDVTLDIFETLWGHGYQQLGVVLQSMLYRSEQDLARVNALGARVRLVKGAYKESKAVAYQEKADVDAAFARMMRVLLTDGHYPAIATHDPQMIALAREWAAVHGVTPDRFEFQMLYGVRRDLQSMLVKAGYRVRIYIPFGREWFPYFMRRLGERPANVRFVIRGILQDRG
jgi:proline dehydrogenase